MGRGPLAPPLNPPCDVIRAEQNFPEKEELGMCHLSKPPLLTI